ncbi:thiol-disulfide oxidoreductase DCC family protein [Chryseotalea sanaruensis]|uniref:Thiol-disulfide oxidoreductase DCC family protein n=1 Tax=Chryseotalea sanaruensis TaxID=2482724 RepID=A0A401UEQ1_9BACT|nr:thiol-disulfide oxidoreductase DCC family protein [Chryseotalea sanaruensis]
MGAFNKVTVEKSIILFDGVCNLCSGAVQFILKRDAKKKFVFASLQSEIGKNLLLKYKVTTTVETIILIQDNKWFSQSEAALEIARSLSGVWPLLYAFKIVPRFIRDGIYNWISSNRYRFFGKKDACMIPSPEWKNRFLD